VATAAVPPVDDRLVHRLSLSSIEPSPRNPRQHADGIAELADSLRAHGLLQPVVVRRHHIGYELIAGHRRFEAARVLGWTEIAAVVRDETDEQAYILTLVENLQREDLSPKEEAAALEVLVRERGWTTRQVGEAIKRDHAYVSRRLRVFEDPVLAPLVLERKFPVSTAEELLRAPDIEVRRDLAMRAAELEWTVGEARRAISEIGANRTKVADLLAHLRRALADAVQIEPESLTSTERKQIRQARAALGRLV
jgi:ParB family chromosome partitioning protein